MPRLTFLKGRGPTRAALAILVVLALLPALSLPLQASAAPSQPAGGITSIQTVDQARSVLGISDSSKITGAAFFADQNYSASKDAFGKTCASGLTVHTPFVTIPEIDYTSPSGVSSNFVLTALYKKVDSDGSGLIGGSPYNDWIFISKDNPQLGFVLRSESHGDDSLFLFVGPNSTLSDQDATDGKNRVAGISGDSATTGLLGCYNPPLHGNEVTPDDADKIAKKFNIQILASGTAGLAGAAGTGAISGLSDPLSSAFSNVSDLINKLLNGIISRYTTLLNSLLTPNSYLNFFQPGGAATSIKTIWASIRTTVDILFILVLLVIAFMNVLRVQIEYYAIRALLPRFIIAAIMVNFSLVIAQVILDATAVLTNSIFAAAPQISLSNISGLVAAAGVGDVLFFNSFILLTIAFGIFTVAAVLVARIAFIWFLVCISPISYLLMVLPITRGLHKWWWDNFITMVLIAPLMSVALLIAADISQPGLFDNSPGGTFLQIALVVALLFVAAILPAVIGGRVLSFIGASIGAQHAGFRKTRLERSRGMQAIRQRSELKDQRAAIEGAKLLDGVGTATFGLAGTQGQRRRLEGGQIKKWKDADQFLDWKQLENQALNGRTDAERRAAAVLIAERDLFGLPNSRLGSDQVEAMHTLRAHLSDDGMADVFKEAGKKNFTWFNDPSIRAMQIDLADKQVLMAPLYGRGKDPVQELAIRLNAEKIGDLSKGAIQALRNSSYAANVNLSMQSLQAMNPRLLNEVATENARNAIAAKIRLAVPEMTARNISYSQAIDSVSDQIANRVRNTFLDDDFYNLLDKEGTTSWGTQTVRNIVRMSPQWTNMTSNEDRFPGGRIPPPNRRPYPGT